jgi:hypothetical protein
MASLCGVIFSASITAGAIAKDLMLPNTSSKQALGFGLCFLGFSALSILFFQVHMARRPILPPLGGSGFLLISRIVSLIGFIASILGIIDL